MLEDELKNAEARAAVQRELIETLKSRVRARDAFKRAIEARTLSAELQAFVKQRIR